MELLHRAARVDRGDDVRAARPGAGGGRAAAAEGRAAKEREAAAADVRCRVATGLTGIARRAEILAKAAVDGRYAAQLAELRRLEAAAVPVARDVLAGLAD